MAKNIPTSYKVKGEEGVEFVKEHCILNALTFEKATDEQDRNDGIDCFINGIGTDVKNTPDLYFLQVFIASGSINVRHPFKKETKAIQLAQIKSSKEGKMEDVAISNIDTLLIESYCKDKEAKEKFLSYLQSLDKKHYTDNGSVSIAQFLFKTKEYIQNTFLNESVKIYYQAPTAGIDECSMRLVKSSGGAKKTTTPLTKGKKPLTENIITILID